MSGQYDQTGDALTVPTGSRGGARLVLLGLGLVGIVAFDQFVGRVWSPAGVVGAGAGGHYGAWVLTPAVVTIVLAIALRQVIPALSIGILVASIMLVPFQPAGAEFGAGLGGSVRLAIEHYLIGGVHGSGALTDPAHVKVIVFSLVICAMVGVIAANGGTSAVVGVVARWGSTRRRGQIATWLAGLLVFFDDYANAMIVGPSMRPVCDRLGISRAKLAYIVDSTAAPVASIAIIGTWIGAEIGFIQDGLTQLTERPEFLAGVGAYQAFLQSIPYRFYAILALLMVLLIGLTGRDYGPMLKAEKEAAGRSGLDNDGDRPAIGGRAWYAIVPVLTLVVLTLVLLLLPGWRAVDWATFQPAPGSWYWVAALQAIMRDADAYNPILYAAVASLFLAGLISVGTGALSLAKTVENALASAARLLPTIVVLTLAWTLSGTMRDLQLGEVAVGLLRSGGFESAAWLGALPGLVFISAAIVSFATGTSWGTMTILCPAVVTIAAGLLGDMPAQRAAPLFYAAVGAVLSGAVFGDHCSPISDTTVLSSMASECSLESHVWTQMPYALTVALVSMVCGDVLCHYAHLSPWVSLLMGAVVLLVVVLAIGRRASGTGNG